jgi:hypothetical protein
MMEGEISENLSFTFFVPISKTICDGVVKCQFLTKPMRHPYEVNQEPKLKEEKS